MGLYLSRGGSLPGEVGTCGETACVGVPEWGVIPVWEGVHVRASACGGYSRLWVYVGRGGWGGGYSRGQRGRPTRELPPATPTAAAAPP